MQTVLLSRCFHVHAFIKPVRRTVAFFGKQDKPWCLQIISHHVEIQLRTHYQINHVPYPLHATNSDSREETTTDYQNLNMENLYQQWTLEDDKQLFENQKKSTVELASMFGRGLRGIEARIAKLKDVNSSVYHRLFVANGKSRMSDEDDSIEPFKKEKLIPASEVLRRIQWDFALPSEDFYIMHYDRVDDEVIQSCVTASNESISGRATNLIDALPEHRIVAIKYKDRIVWDREKRLDLFFSDKEGGIISIVQNYETWKQERDAAILHNRQRQAELALRLKSILGLEREEKLLNLSKNLQATVNSHPVQAQYEAEHFVKCSIKLFREIRDDPCDSAMPDLIPISDHDALDIISELVSLLPDENLRNIMLTEVDVSMKRALSKKVQKVVSPVRYKLPDLLDTDLTETFIRGSGPGGQKVNKTSNRVVLVHEPTQIRVECQDTRSLQQNRKIARIRLQQKLDDHLNGSKSKSAIKAQEASTKKAKAKAKARSRVKKRDNETFSVTDEQNPDDLDIRTDE